MYENADRYRRMCIILRYMYNNVHSHTYTIHLVCIRYSVSALPVFDDTHERWGAGVETQKNVRGEIGGWGRVPFNEPYAPSLSTIYDGA